jgi:farnesyl-diphosphate farnesyltransferase
MKETMSLPDDLAYQAKALPLVSRTFALTIPQLPAGLVDVVGNAYLLCRLADTIEDDVEMDSAMKAAFMSEFLKVIDEKAGAEDFAGRLVPQLSSQTSDSERELVANTATVVRITSAFSAAQRKAVIRGVTTMCKGMPEFQNHNTLDGLPGLVDLDRYCYFVAGIVGEMLTDLFCEHCDQLAEHREEMMALAVCFGQGLQMTNILKDVWEDRESDICWLPRSLFTNLDGGLPEAMRNRDSESMAAGIGELVGIAHAQLKAALRYTQLIPKSEPGIRRFCLWAIGMAILTLRKIYNNPGYLHGNEVKISRRAVKMTILACDVAQHSNRTLELLFNMAGRGLPLAPEKDFCPPQGARLASDRLS